MQGSLNSHRITGITSMEVLVLLFTFFASTVSFSDDFPICTTATVQNNPVVAWDGENYLVVWHDRTVPDTVYDVLAQLVSKDGDLIGTSFAISSAPGPQLKPAIAWGDTTGLVVWQDNRIQSGDIYGQIVGRHGRLIDTNFAICTHPELQWSPEVAWNGVDYLVVWRDRRNYLYFSIYGQIVSSNGALVGDNFAIGEVPGNQRSCAIAWGDTCYLIAWADYRSGTDYDIYGQRVSSNGSLLGTNFAICSTHTAYDSLRAEQRFPAVAFDGNNFLVVWEQVYEWELMGVNSDIYGQMVSTQGTLIDTPFAIAVTDVWRALYKGIPAITWSGADYVVVYQYGGLTIVGCDIFGQRVSKDGTLIGEEFYVSMNGEAHSSWSSIASGETNSLVVWQDDRRSENLEDIYGNIEIGTGIEEHYQLTRSENYTKVQPNPFNKSTVISYQVSEPGCVTLRIYDLGGRLIKTLISKEVKSGGYTVDWDGTNDSGAQLPIGVYFCQLKTGSHAVSKKIVFLK